MKDHHNLSMAKAFVSSKLESLCLAEDLADENHQLRHEVQRLASLLVCDIDDKLSDDNNSSTLESCMDSSNGKSSIKYSVSNQEKASNKPCLHKLLVENDNLRKEISTLQKNLEYFDSHCKGQASTIKSLSEKLNDMKHSQRLMEADLLELFPLRLKLRELEKVLKGHNELILSLQLDNCEYVKKLKDFDLIKAEHQAQQETIHELTAKMSHHQSLEQDLKQNLSEQLKNVTELNQIINKNQLALERQATVEREICKQVSMLKKQMDACKLEKAAMQFNHDIEKDQLNQEIFQLQRQIKAYEETIRSQSAQQEEAKDDDDDTELADHSKCAHWKGVCRANHLNKRRNSKESQRSADEEETATCSFLPSLFSSKAVV